MFQICLVRVDQLEIVRKDKNSIECVNSKCEADHNHKPKDNPTRLVGIFTPKYKVQYEERSGHLQNHDS